MSQALSEGLRFEPNDKGTVYRLVGDLTFASALAALRGASQVLDCQAGGIGFDLSGIRHVDSAGVALLIEWLLMARKSGCHLTLSHVPQNLRAIMQVNGVLELVPMAQETEATMPNSI